MGQFRVRNLAGDLLLEMESESMVHLKQKVSEVCGVPEALLKVVKDNEALGNLTDLEEIAVTDEVVELMVLVDDSPCYSWDIAGNPDSEFLKSDASAVVEFVNPDACLHPDYVNVLSQSPIEKGVHFVEFILHSLQDEQWCGVTFCASRAGRRGEQAPGVYYYCGRRSSGQGHLDVLHERKHMMPFEHVKSGDAIGMLLDANRGAVLFLIKWCISRRLRAPFASSVFEHLAGCLWWLRWVEKAFSGRLPSATGGCDSRHQVLREWSRKWFHWTGEVRLWSGSSRLLDLWR